MMKILLPILGGLTGLICIPIFRWLNGTDVAALFTRGPNLSAMVFFSLVIAVALALAGLGIGIAATPDTK